MAESKLEELYKGAKARVAKWQGRYMLFIGDKQFPNSQAVVLSEKVWKQTYHEDPKEFVQKTLARRLVRIEKHVNKLAATIKKLQEEQSELMDTLVAEEQSTK